MKPLQGPPPPPCGNRVQYRMVRDLRRPPDGSGKIYARFEKVDTTRGRSDAADVEQRRSTAWLCNQLLSNPKLPLQPVVVLHETHGIVAPDPKFFPKNARDFYALRTPRTDRQRSKLAYLVAFYRVGLPEEESDEGREGEEEDGKLVSPEGLFSGKEAQREEDDDTGRTRDKTKGPFRYKTDGGAHTVDDCTDDDNDNDDNDNDSDDDDEHTFPDRNHLAVYKLEGILGLCEANFLSFFARARARAGCAPGPVPKRPQEDAPPSADAPDLLRRPRPAPYDWCVPERQQQQHPPPSPPQKFHEFLLFPGMDWCGTMPTAPTEQRQGRVRRSRRAREPVRRRPPRQLELRPAADATEAADDTEEAAALVA